MSSKTATMKDKLIQHFTNLCATLDKEMKQSAILRNELMKERKYNIANYITRFERDILILQGRAYRELNDLTDIDKTIENYPFLHDDVD